MFPVSDETLMSQPCVDAGTATFTHAMLPHHRHAHSLSVNSPADIRSGQGSHKSANEVLRVLCIHIVSVF